MNHVFKFAGVSYMFSRNVTFGQPHMECLDCHYDSHGVDAESLMADHCRSMRHGIVSDGKMTIAEYIDAEMDNDPQNVIITFCYLCWNTCLASREGALALHKETSRIDRLNCHANLVVLDNGSTDDTYPAIASHLGRQAVVVREHHNLGISRARNRLVDIALGLGAKYILLMDGDIEVVPLSPYVMMRYLECHPNVGCIGAYSGSHTDNRAHVTPHLFEIPESRVHKDISCAFTQYGLFRADMFRNGLRFDEGGPFGEPGWGFEDDDLFYQMQAMGYENRYFSGICYLHRSLRSSWQSISRLGIDVVPSIEKRRAYLLDKWRGRGLDGAILKSIESQQYA